MPTTTSPDATTRNGNDVANRLRFTIMRLARRLRQQNDGGDVTPSGTSALSSLDRLGPLTLGRLAAVERVRPPSITKIVDRLEELGLVQREAAPGDRRSSVVSLTPAGQRHLVQGRDRKTAYLASRLEALPADDLARLAAALPILEKLVSEDDD